MLNPCTFIEENKTKKRNYEQTQIVNETQTNSATKESELGD